MHALLCLTLLALPARDADRVVVVRNLDSPVSCRVAADYCRKRAVRSVVSVHCADSAVSAAGETIQFADYQKAIAAPMRPFLASRPGIDFIVLTKGVPIRIEGAPGRGANNSRPSLDSTLASLDYERAGRVTSVRFQDGGFTGTAYVNRYWNAMAPFSHARYGGYLVTRLDGYTEADAKALVARALQAEKARPNGVVLLDTCLDIGYSDAGAAPIGILAGPGRPGVEPTLNDLAWQDYNADMVHAAGILQARRIPVELDRRNEFVGNRQGLMGYASWGSNDRHFDAAAYHSLRFAPGGICETAVSTSGRTFLPTTGGQSLIADLVAQGAAGAKCYTDEPLLQAVASASILFDRYTRGYTLAESFYAASRFVGWEDVVLGDPLCRPYRR